MYVNLALVENDEVCIAMILNLLPEVLDFVPSSMLPRKGSNKYCQLNVTASVV